MNQNRRVFRGRGGPTDRRLPKHQARRRKPHPATSTTTTSETNDAAAAITKAVDLPPPPSDSHVILEQPLESSLPEPTPLGDNEQATLPDRQQVQHLMHRIGNNRRTMETSSKLKTLSNYQTLVLDAIQNTVKEWKHVRLQQHLTVSDQHRMQQEVFGLIQQAMQCGPLAGAKPGYMKRCGADVARQVELFLTDISDICVFTERQTQTLETWKRNARKAFERNNNQKPSDSSNDKSSGIFNLSN